VLGKLLITQSVVESEKSEAESLIKALKALKFEVQVCPIFLLNPVPLPISISSPVEWQGSEDLIFITRLSVEVFHQSGLPLPLNSRCFSIGAGTAETFRHYFPKHFIEYPRDSADQNSEGLLKLSTLQAVSGRRIFIFRGSHGREFLADELRQRGALVEYVTCYERRVNPAFHQFWMDPCPHFIPDILVLTSTESLKIFLETPRLDHFKAPWITLLSGRMKSLALEYGYHKILLLEEASNEGIISRMSQFDKNSTC